MGNKLIFLGTGTSSNIPVICCLVAKPPTCNVCLAAVTEEGKKNRRRNTSVIVQLDSENGERPKTILIDCGKNFYEAALNVFPKNGLSEIDAVLLTHPHADAINGLDDLRGWTMNGPQSTLHIYLTQETYDTIARAAPYMVDASKATGGGDVPAFTFHIFSPENPFNLLTCNNVQVTPLPVHHGSYFGEQKSKPFWCMGFRICNLSYISDTNFIPPSTKSLMEGSKVVVLDALRSFPHASHFSFDQAHEFVESMEKKPKKVFILGSVIVQNTLIWSVHLPT
ncbi:hydrolase [Schizosaccharomyces japonicus yFS275]|uniref:Hydrolase n=1 Tax=Schizosaccharomyces japonicus (strain yFS275 / FY16936) TaxID=402676 RepID=B6JYH3_SCHJY|nr:hydrolase [Schizosaccharomyces japonicus yFS275]EEB06591.2 hydrolase [Schizosaccharomyces japonicus yFS275]